MILGFFSQRFKSTKGPRLCRFLPCTEAVVPKTCQHCEQQFGSIVPLDVQSICPERLVHSGESLNHKHCSPALYLRRATVSNAEPAINVHLFPNHFFQPDHFQLHGCRTTRADILPHQYRYPNTRVHRHNQRGEQADDHHRVVEATCSRDPRYRIQAAVHAVACTVATKAVSDNDYGGKYVCLGSRWFNEALWSGPGRTPNIRAGDS